MRLYYNGDTGEFEFGKSNRTEGSNYVGNDDSSAYVGLMSAQMTNRNNLALAKQQNDWNVEMWNKQNEYNSPSAQLQRYREAGINPLFASIDGGQAQQLNSANLANQVPGTYDPNYKVNKRNMEIAAAGQVLEGLNNIMSYQVQAQQLRNDSVRLQYQGQDIASTVAQRAAQTRGQNITNSNMQRQFDDAHNSAIESINNLKANNRLTTDQAETLEKALPFVEKLNRKQLAKLDQEIKGLKLDNEGKVSDNAIKQFKANLTKSGINPDADGLQQLVQLCVTNPEGVGEIINKLTAGLMKSFNDVLTENPVVKKASEAVDTVSDRIMQLFGSNSHKNPDDGYLRGHDNWKTMR